MYYMKARSLKITAPTIPDIFKERNLNCKKFS